MSNRDTRNHQGSTHQSIQQRSISFSLIFILLCLLLDFSSASKSPLPIPAGTSTAVSSINNVPTTITQSTTPNWFQNLRQRLKFNKLQFDSDGDVSPLLGNGLMISLRWSLMAYIGFELFNVMKDVIQELKEENGGAGGLFGTTTGTLISKSNTERLLTWMANDDPTKPPPYQVPYMILQIALQLQASGMPLISSTSDNANANDPPSIADILPRLSKAQAELLTDCLLVPDRSVTLNSVSGLIQIRQAMSHYLPKMRINNKTADPTNKNPYAKFVSAQHQQGILLYGPPGCGKSLLIQAFCNDCRRPTFVVAPSTLQSKYYGESNQRVKLLWSLVDLFQNHCVLVLDELDGLFRARNMDQEHEVSREVKTEFLQLWDGVMALKNNNNNNNNNNSNNNHHQLVVIGATNRPFDVDPAVARRLPQSFFIGLPPLEDRRALLQMWCRQFEIPMAFDLLEQLAQATHLYTPSDLKQVLKQACQGGPLARGDLQLHLADFHLAMQQVPATKLHSSYVSKMQQYMGVMVHNHPNYPPPPHGGGGGADAAADGGNGYHQIGKWETHMGNFYHVGHVPVDDATLDALDHILTNYEPASSSSSEGGYSSDDEGYNNSSEEREGGEDDL